MPGVLRQEVPVMGDVLQLLVMVMVVMAVVSGLLVLLLDGFGHEPECGSVGRHISNNACGCPAEPSSDAVMCGQCEQEAQAAAGMCRLCWSLPGTHDELCRKCDATVRAEVEREATL